ncbi:hypothetical protein P5673_033083, partial [Acropora cervicornis]
MDPWINNIPVFGQSDTPFYRQLSLYSDPNASQQHPGASNCMPFAPLYQPGLTVYNTASSNENQSDSSSPSLCEPAGSTRSDDITAQKKMWLKEEGHVTYDAKSCETKFKNLKRSYTACIDHNKKTGNDRKKCAFYDELNRILYGDDNIEPPAVYSNRKGLVKRNQPENQECPTVRKFEESSESTASEKQEEENNIKKKKTRKKPPSESSELVSLFKEFVDRKEEKEEKKLQKLQEMHDEKMTFFGQFLK